MGFKNFAIFTKSKFKLKKSQKKKKVKVLAAKSNELNYPNKSF